MPQLQINQGPQDALLYDNSKSYFTNVGYVRTSNFQMELRDISSQNNAANGSEQDVGLDRLSGCQCCSALDATRSSLVRRVSHTLLC